MKTENRLVYVCEYCDTYSIDKDFIERHETYCGHNPEKRRCLSCAHYEEDWKVSDEDYRSYEPVDKCRLHKGLVICCNTEMTCDSWVEKSNGV